MAATTTTTKNNNYNKQTKTTTPNNTNDNNNMIHTIHHASSDSSIKVHTYGATVLSYVAKDREHLFVSKTAICDGTKPIRGGIPIVFPIFGPPPPNNKNDNDNVDTMPQHGFARRNNWSIVSQYDTMKSAGMILELIVTKDSVEDGVGDHNEWSKWIYGCTLRYEIDFTSERLITKLRIMNTGTIPFPFQALLHTYYQIDQHQALNPKVCYIKGLDGYIVTDKVNDEKSGTIHKDENHQYITIHEEVDRVYTPPQSSDTTLDIDPNQSSNTVQVTIGVGTDKTVQMVAEGFIRPCTAVDISTPAAPSTTVDKDKQVQVPVSCVVWNPHIEKTIAMSDFDNEQYHDMVCVEPGLLSLSDLYLLQPKYESILQQTLYSSTQ